jgi:ABC-type multidrug transport system ATPase subunit
MSIRLLEVTRRFGAQLALDRVSLNVRRGDCYGFIGHNGAGKTTAMRIVLGLQRPDTGSVLVDGFDVSDYPREARARLGGLIEVPGFHGELSGATNLRMVAGLQGLTRSAGRVEAARLIELVGLAHAGRKPVRAYSHGMRQRLGIALALLGGPRYVLLDEPTNGLDPEGIAEIRDLLRHLVVDEGVTVMISSHQLHELAGICNRVGVLQRGRLLAEAETKALLGGGEHRYAVRTDDPAKATALLADLGATLQSGQGGELVVDLGTRKPAEISRALFERGLAVETFAPKPATLEEIYLRYAHSSSAALAGPGGEPAPKPTAPAQRKAPRWPLLRVARYELQRWGARPPALILLALPAVLAALALWRRRAELQAAQAQIEAGQLFSATDVTAFEGAGLALRAGLPLLGLIAAGVASQAIAGEASRGTLRNVVLRPVRRVQVGVGKAGTHLLVTLLSYGLLALVALLLAGWLFGYRDLVEILPNGEHFPLVPASDLWPQLRLAVLSPLTALAACVGIGFLAGTLVTNAAAALALALGSLLFLDLARSIARGLGQEGLLPTAYLPSPLGDTSFLKLYADLAQGISNSTFEHASTALTVPLAWSLVCFLLACLVLARRSLS